MKYTTAIIISLVCAAVQAHPVPDDYDSNDVGADDSVSNFVDAWNNFWGSFGGGDGAKAKRGLLSDVNMVIDEIAKRSPEDDNEDDTDCPDGEDSAGVSDDSDDSSVSDDASLTANEVENGISEEAGDQTDLSKRTIAASVGGLIDVDVDADIDVDAGGILA